MEWWQVIWVGALSFYVGAMLGSRGAHRQWEEALNAPMTPFKTEADD